MTRRAALLEWVRRLWGTLRRERRGGDLQDELASHLAFAEEDARARGDSPEEAARAARLRAGGVVQAMEALNDQRGLPWLENLSRDLRHSLRDLARSPGFALVTISTLALGIGANTGIFSILNAALLRPLPYPEPERLVAVYSVNPSPNGGLWTVAPADYKDWRAESNTLEELAAYSGGGISLWTGDRPESIQQARVTSNFFVTLGVEPLLGRGFTPEDELTTNTVVLSHRLWQSRFGADPDIVGSPIRTADGAVTVVGVMPPSFEFPDYAEAWTPIWRGEMDRRATRYWRIVGRLRDGPSIEAARSELVTIAGRLGELYPTESRGWSADVVPFNHALVLDIRHALWILMGAVAFVIVIACANVAGLILARNAARRRELAVCLALGATRWRLVRQVFVENLLVALLGAAGGLAVARWSIGPFFSLVPQTSWTSLVRYRDGVDLDFTVLLFAVSMAVGTAVVLTFAPMLASRRFALADAVRGGGSTRTRGEHRSYKALVVAQVACAIVLLAGAGLLVQSFVRMLDVENGYDPRGMITLSLSLQQQDWPVFLDDTLKRINAAPGVAAAAVMSYERFGQLNLPFNIQDAPFPDGDVLVRYSSVTSDYFRVLGARVLAGRVFDERDSAQTQGVAVINESLAREYFPDGDAVGRDIVLAYNNERMSRRIVGVVSDIRQDAPYEPIKPEILVPWTQLPWLSGTLVLRKTGELTGTERRVQEIIWSVHKNAPASRIQTVEEILDSQVATRRLYTILLSLFSTVAVALALLGIYGLLNYIVGRHRREMAIRIAVGAGIPTIIRMVIGEGLRLAVVGIAIGLAGTLVLTRLMRSLLFETPATDPATFAGVALLLLGVASAACYLPARRAAKTDPMATLRQD